MSIAPASNISLLLLTNRIPQLCRRSGYSLLTEYLPASVIAVERKNPRLLMERLANRAVRSWAFTDWYQLQSARLELNAWRYIRRNRPDIVHMLWADSDLGYLDMLPAAKSFRLCGTFHHCEDTLAQVLRFGSRLKRLDAFIVMSETQARFFQKQGVPAERIHLVLHGVDTTFFHPAKTRGSSTFSVLSVGSYRRNFQRLQDICKGLERESIRVVVIGPAQIMPLFAHLPNVEVLSGIDDSALVRAYQTASCFLLTTEQSTANNALLEAMACGVPVISERVGGIPEYTTADCAVLFEAGDVASCVRAIVRLRDSAQLREEMGAAAREHAETLDWTRVAGRTLTVYRSLMDARSAA